MDNSKYLWELDGADISILRNIAYLEADEYDLEFLKIRYEEDLEKIEEIRENEMRSNFGPEGHNQSRSFQALNQLGLIEETALGNKYKIASSPEYFEILEQRLGRVKEELVETMKEEKEKGNKITKTRFDSSDDLPDASEYERKAHFDSWYNALWHAGIKPAQEKYDRDIITDKLLDMTHNRSKVPNFREFTSAANTPSSVSVGNHFEDYEELMEESGLSTRKKIQESTDKGDKYYVEDEIDEEVKSEIEEDFEILF